MSSTGPIKQARKSLLWLGVIFLISAAILITGVLSGKAAFAPKLALDLEGGTQMILAPRVQGGAAATQEQLDQAVEIIRQRVDGTGVSEAEITTQSGRNIVVSMPGVPDTRTRELIQASANMEFRPVIISGSFTAVPEDQRLAKADLPVPSAEPENGSDPNWIDAALYQAFEKFDCPTVLSQGSDDVHDAEKPMISCDPDMGAKYILGPVAVPGSDISDASFGMVRGQQGATTGQWAVNLEFNAEGTTKFAEVTQRLTGLEGAQNQFAIVLDGNVISAPTSNAVIPNGNAQITGNFTEQSSKAMADQLKFGALPISFEIQSEQQISATLGSDQLRSGLIAGLIGMVLVAIYSLFQYRLLGLVTIVSLVASGVLTYLALVLLGWSMNYRLSLAGVAGLIVAIGLIADSFIVYFERIRDELRDGRPLASAVEIGWKRAKRTILASKAVNILAAVVLYVVAVGNVRGFAFTLGLTAVVDIIIVFLFTHPILQLISKTKFFGEGHRFSGLDPSLLGAEPLYRGAGKVRSFNTDAEVARGKKNAKAASEAERRQTIAERRKAAVPPAAPTQQDDRAEKDSTNG